GTGDDVYYIEAGDIVIEEGGGGYDTIVASYSAILGDNTQVEVLQAAAGTAPLSIGGANMNDTLIGNDGHNVINGGTGADRMVGQGGNDTYYVDNVFDTVVETSAAGGDDHVFTSVNFTLGAFVEKLTAMGTLGLALTGNTLNNTMIGTMGRDTIRAEAGADTISGGLGNDMLTGGAGKDMFVFDTAGHKTRNKDKILDWNYRDDTIKLDQDIFKKLKIGKLQSKYFTLGAVAKDGNDYIGVNKATGDVWYDPNGDKPGKQVIFANIGKNKAIFASDFEVF
ncbi:calcium-binding protein, partial [Microvirga sp. P5_D2]